ncbi:hypothetical protein [Xanthomonas campestris]|uniref:hypothetical protein n=1 Tax=Xanthomonas campestris TaxID=339 RepID=UPI0011C41E24|nr:hypothetical protein [Xanthomonas campestris]
MNASTHDPRLQLAETRQPARARPLLPVMLVAVAAALIRLIYVQQFAVAIPFWDQWDAEGLHLLKPWIEGSLRMVDLLAPHNEHRILPTRLVTLTVYALTGTWNNLYEARASTLIYALIPASLSWIALRNGSLGRHRWLLVGLALLFSALPFGWENFLIGFQSQFYFLIVFGIATVAIAASRHDNLIACGLVVLLSAVSCITMASGLLTPIAAAAVYLVACVVLPGRRWPALLTCAVLIPLAVLAFLKTPVILPHQTMRPHDLLHFADALNHILGWPIIGYHWAVFYLWLLCPIMFVRLTWRKQVTRTDLIMAGLAGWSTIQALAIAMGRGQGLIELTPRYSELLLPGLFANAWFALRMWQVDIGNRRIRWAARIATTAFAGVLLGGLIVRTPLDWGQLVGRSGALALQQQNTLRYLRTGDPEALSVPHFEIPYPRADLLRQMLDDPTLRRILPNEKD